MLLLYPAARLLQPAHLAEDGVEVGLGQEVEGRHVGAQTRHLDSPGDLLDTLHVKK